MGYHVLESASWLDALYMTVITLATVGFREVVEVSTPGKIFTIFLIVFGVAIVGWAVRNLLDFAADTQVHAYRRRRRMQKRINHLHDHCIICGYGRTGQEVLRQLRRAGVSCVVIDMDGERLAPLGEMDVPYLVGDAASEEVLLAAGIKRARGLLATASPDAQNVFIVLTARGLNPDLFIAARSVREEDETKLRRAGADRVVSVHLLGGRRLAAAVLRPAVLDFLDLVMHGEEVEFVLEEFRINEVCTLCGLTLREAQLRERYGVTVLGKKTAAGQFYTNPTPEMSIEPGDTLIVVGTTQGLAHLQRTAHLRPLIGGPTEPGQGESNLVKRERSKP